MTELVRGPQPEEVQEALGALVEAGDGHRLEQSRESLEAYAHAALEFAEVYWAAERARRRGWEQAEDRREEEHHNGTGV